VGPEPPDARREMGSSSSEHLDDKFAKLLARFETLRARTPKFENSLTVLVNDARPVAGSGFETQINEQMRFGTPTTALVTIGGYISNGNRGSCRVQSVDLAEVCVRLGFDRWLSGEPEAKRLDEYASEIDKRGEDDNVCSQDDSDVVDNVVVVGVSHKTTTVGWDPGCGLR